jgi:hypothetical protein
MFLLFRRRPLTSSVPTEQRAPPSLPRGADLLKVPRPEQPVPTVGQAHVYGYVIFSPVPSHDLTHKASALGDPVVFHDPNPHTGTRLFGCHEIGAPIPHHDPSHSIKPRKALENLYSWALSARAHGPGGSWSVWSFSPSQSERVPPPSSSGPVSLIPGWHTLVLKCLQGCHETQGAPRHRHPRRLLIH